MPELQVLGPVRVSAPHHRFIRRLHWVQIETPVLTGTLLHLLSTFCRLTRGRTRHTMSIQPEVVMCAPVYRGPGSMWVGTIRAMPPTRCSRMPLFHCTLAPVESPPKMRDAPPPTHGRDTHQSSRSIFFVNNWATLFLVRPSDPSSLGLGTGTGTTTGESAHTKEHSVASSSCSGNREVGYVEMQHMKQNSPQSVLFHTSFIHGFTGSMALQVENDPSGVKMRSCCAHSESL